MYYIYRIINLINGKTYIGQHKYKKYKKEGGTLLWNEWRKFQKTTD